MISMRCVILFTDVHDFSIASVKLGEKVAPFLQEMYEVLGERIVQTHGTILKYAGDSIVAVFADKSQVAVVRSALRMREAFAALVSKWSLPASTVLEIGVGSGPVVRGTVGHRSLRTEDVFGEEVNVTAMICHHRGVAITQPVYERVKDSFVTEPLEPRALKWRDEPAAVWAVNGEIATSARG